MTRVAVALVLWALAGPPGAGAQPQSAAGEYQIKAAYLYNFGRFVEWPANVGADDARGFLVCVIGRDPFGSVLDSTLKQGAINAKATIPRRVSLAEDIRQCRILFISASEEADLESILKALGHAPVLTVSDMPGFTGRGGMINFVLDGNRVRFEINLASAHEAGLVLRSDLLRVARTVHK